MNSSLNSQLVNLRGTPREVGRAFGEVSAAAIQRDIASFRNMVVASGLTPGETKRRVNHYQSIVDRLAPYWPEEMTAIAEAAGVDDDLYTTFVAQKYVIRVPTPTPTPPPHECTSFLAVGNATADGRSILHKNRDMTPRPQGLWIRAITGTHRYLGGGDASDHGLIHFVNEYGLAGAMNAGSPNDHTIQEGLPTPQILRLIAEKAKTCEDALSILQEIVGQGWYTNGTSGSIWLFTSPAKGLVVENTHQHLDYQWIYDDVHARANDFFLPETLPFTRPDALTNTRYLSARDGMARIRGNATVAAINNLSRHTTSAPQQVCGTNTLSGFTAVTDRQQTNLLAMAWIALGHPNNALYIPFYVGAEGVPAYMIDGTFWELSARLHGENPDGPHPGLDFAAFEHEIAAEADTLHQKALHLIETGKTAQAVTLLTESSANWCQQALAQLDGALSAFVQVV